MSSLFKKPSELTAKPGLVAMIYGSPGSGKSTLASSAPGAVMIDTDGGVMRINGAHQVPTLQVQRWEDVVAAVKELRQDASIQSVIVDTVGKLLDYMMASIKQSNPRYVQRDGTVNVKAYGVRKNMFNEFIRDLTTVGKNVIFVAHDKEEKADDITKVRPEVGGSSTNDLMKELDLVGYVEMKGNQRTISFTPTERFYAKNTCDMPGVINIPLLIDANGQPVGDNNFFAQVIQNYRQRVARSLENNRKLDELRGLIEANVEGVSDAESANNFVEWIAGVDHVYNSKAIALDLFQKRVKALGLTYDKSEKKYVGGEI